MKGHDQKNFPALRSGPVPPPTFKFVPAPLINPYVATKVGRRLAAATKLVKGGCPPLQPKTAAALKSVQHLIINAWMLYI